MRSAALLVVIAAAVAGVVAAVFRHGHDSTKPSPAAPATRSASSATVVARTRRVVPPVTLRERPTGSLGTPVQDAAAVALGGGRAMLLGGLTAADTSRAEVVVATASGDRAAGALPVAVHDTAAVRLGGAVYVFGGGTEHGRTERRDRPRPGLRRPRRGRRPAAGAELRPGGRSRRRRRLCRRRLHGQPLARHDRGVASGNAATCRRSPAVSAAVRSSHRRRRRAS